MKWALLSVSIFWIIIGCCSVLYTEGFRDAAKKTIAGTGEKLLIGITFLIGLILAVSAFLDVSSSKSGVGILGALVLAKGALWITNPNNYMNNIKQWYLNKASMQTYRFFGIIMIILGVVVFGWCKI